MTETKSVFWKILVSWCQVNVLTLSFGFDWGPTINGVMETTEEVSTIGTAYVEVGCFFPDVPSAFVIEIIVWMILPVAVVTSILLVLLIVQQMPQASSPDPEVEEQAETKDVDDKKQEGGAEKEEEEDDTIDYDPSLYDSAVAVACIVMFVFHTELTALSARMFNCVQLGRELDEFFLADDLNIRCWSTEHWAILSTFGIPLLAIYVAGIPLVTLLLILWNRRKVDYLALKDEIQHELTKYEKMEIAEYLASYTKDQHAQLHRESRRFFWRFGFLMVGYEPRTSWWEMVVTMRKVVLSLASVLFQSEPRVQTLVAMLILMFASMAHTRFGPYVADELDVYEFLSLVSTALLFFCGALTSGSGVYAAFFKVAAVVIILGTKSIL